MLAIKLDIVVNDLTDMLALYNRIEVHRSTTGESGFYTEITDPAGPTSAIVDASQSSWGTISGLDLTLSIDEEDLITITLSDEDPMPLQSIIDSINAVVPGLASEVPMSTNRLRLTSPTSGTGSSLKINAGTLATTLGLSTTKVNGKSRRIRLVTPTTLYSFLDLDSDNSFWYKTRFSNTDNSNISDFSSARQGNINLVIASTNLVRGTIDLVDGFGRPVVGRRIIFIPIKPTSITSSSYWIIPGFDARVEVLTNEAGHASADLVKNVLYRVIIEGTFFIREFTAPDNTNLFDILSVVGSVPDSFDIVKTPQRPIKVTI